MNKHTTTQGNSRSPRLWALALVAGSALLFSGCAKDPVSTERTDNAAITVDFLFEKDGVKVYRFYDGGRPIYYTDARGATQWSERHSSGKSSYSVTKTVPTER